MQRAGRYRFTPKRSEPQSYIDPRDEMAAWGDQDPAEPMFAALGAALRDNAAWCLLGALIVAGVAIVVGTAF